MSCDCFTAGTLGSPASRSAGGVREACGRDKPSLRPSSYLIQDLTLLKLALNDLPYLPIADSDQIQVLETAYVLGYPTKDWALLSQPEQASRIAQLDRLYQKVFAEYAPLFRAQGVIDSRHEVDPCTTNPDRTPRLRKTEWQRGIDGGVESCVKETKRRY